MTEYSRCRTHGEVLPTKDIDLHILLQQYDIIHCYFFLEIIGDEPEINYKL